MPTVEHAAIHSQIAELTREHVFPAAQALAEAFSTEPLKGLFLSRSIPRRWFVIVLARIFRAHLRAHLTAGKPAYVAVAGGEVVGAVVIAPPRRSRGGSAGHWKIVLLGVRPGWRGRGVGSSLMDRAHALCDRDPSARGVYLSTHGRRNRSFYERLGYRITGQVRLWRFEFYRMVRPHA